MPKARHVGVAGDGGLGWVGCVAGHWRSEGVTVTIQSQKRRWGRVKQTKRETLMLDRVAVQCNQGEGRNFSMLVNQFLCVFRFFAVSLHFLF